ncbi:MAG TPA: peptidoglycan DD-metalloendopeptidase family protein [Rhizomicrobium sp.]|nr:peptidoglycan DD-metalloendopeptidase family protein [Rhizomicrobium sp.]
MAGTLIERAWAWLHATFPERQVYIRSDGRVQFFTFGPTLQATMAGLSLIFLGWVAFASVNVIFKDRIIAAKDHRYQQMQSTYENRVADLQVSYDELNGALIGAEDKFKQTADELQNKQTTVARLLGQKQAVDQTLSSISAGAVLRQGSDTPDDDIPQGSASGASDSVGDAGPAAHSGASQLNVMPQSAAPQPRTARPALGKQSMLETQPSADPAADTQIQQMAAADTLSPAAMQAQAQPQGPSLIDQAMSRIAGALFHPRRPAPAAHVPNAPAFRILAEQTERIRSMSGQETSLLVGVDREVSSRIDELETVLKRVGVNPAALEQPAGIGGPFIPINTYRIDGISDQTFTQAYVGAIAHSKELETLFGALHHVPLTTPVHGNEFERTSGFGPRIDPFTHRIGFHPGVDFAGPWGATVSSTAAGTVVWAGPRGGYGNLVEIDHGYGFRTRYGHLASILVRVGAKVQKGTPIGKLGSTGRSTGPHVHYEVWLGDVVRNPSTYIEAGRHVLQ